MSFAGFLDDNNSPDGSGSGNGNGGTAGGGGGGRLLLLPDLPYLTNNNMTPHPRFMSPPPPPSFNTNNKSSSPNMFNSPGLSLGLQTGLEGGVGGRGEFTEHFVANGGGGSSRRSRDDEHESRSGSDNMLDAGASGDDQDAADDGKPPRKKRYHRHTPQQIQELEAVFKECPHPDEKQRLELSRRLCLETRQVKFWFQNRRTQMKTQLERHENSILRQENDKLRVENLSMRDAMRNPVCTNCGGPAIMGEISMEEQHLRIENARLKDELDRVCSLASKFVGRPVSSLSTMSTMAPLMPSSDLELGMGMHNHHHNHNNGFGSVVTTTSAVPLPLCGPPGPDHHHHHHHFMTSGGGMLSPTKSVNNNSSTGIERSLERSMYLELALTAMDELIKMAHSDVPLWVRSSASMESTTTTATTTGREILNREEFARGFGSCIGPAPNGFVSEASKETGMVIINSMALVETLMDSNRWADMFPCMIARTSTTEVIANGMGGTRNGALQLMHAELQVLSPLVPVRVVNFLRFCKQHAEGLWAVVDVSVDCIRESSSSSQSSPNYVNCRRLPSGCVVQDMPNGYSKVTWVEHVEYDESAVHQLYRPLISSGLGFGAQRWVATLQRQCECLAILMSSNLSSHDHDHAAAITAGGRRSMLKLAQRMTDSFCAGVCCGSSIHKWSKMTVGSVGRDVRVMTRQSVDDPGEPSGIVLSAATSVWLQGVHHHRVFSFLRDERLRSEWDILSNGGPMQEMAHIAKGQDHGNSVSLLRASAVNPNQSSMLILQETCTDASGSLVVYAPVDIPAMHVVMNGGDSAYVALLPSGFAIVPDGPPSSSSGELSNNDGNGTGSAGGGGGGSLLTVAFQILVNSLPSAKLTVESVDTVNNLIACTVQKIKAALQCDS